ncbi:MlaC/ttg2D family ABC transporter substrate-binding protein [Malaciobacter mytili]|uniref:MlaC/ttg2D family ABC transporter substrate-binding protein n=2 Tax=Malaciobacter mytili TaxID=603050 RepID=UPI003A8555DB
MLKKFIAILLLTTSLFAMQKEDIKENMSKNIYNVLEILKNKSLSKEQKGKEIIKIMDTSFDYQIMSMLALGSNWKSISNEQKSNFSKAFEIRLKDSYIDKLELYTNQKMQINELEEIKNRLVLKTLLVGEKENFPIDYKFYKNNKNNQWFIYDVNILGVSIIQTYRTQFEQYLKDKSIESLIEYLKTKNEV